MKLLSLNLQNFRGIKSLNINFEGKSANIYGANGIGKTTIANSISYLLTGQPLTNEKDFSPKTSDTHNLHHIVNGVFELDNGEQISLSKDYYEVYRQKKGELAEKLSGHTTDRPLYKWCSCKRKRIYIRIVLVKIFTCKKSSTRVHF